MGKKLRIHDGEKRADDLRQLERDLDVVLSYEADRLTTGVGKRDLDRAAIRACFVKARLLGFFDLDFEAPIAEFISAVHEICDNLWLWAELDELYPIGILDRDDLIKLELPNDFGPDE